MGRMVEQGFATAIDRSAHSGRFWRGWPKARSGSARLPSPASLCCSGGWLRLPRGTWSWHRWRRAPGRRETGRQAGDGAGAGCGRSLVYHTKASERSLSLISAAWMMAWTCVRVTGARLTIGLRFVSIMWPVAIPKAIHAIRRYGNSCTIGRSAAGDNRVSHIPPYDICIMEPFYCGVLRIIGAQLP